MTQPRDNRFVWVTWLTKLMAGENSCIWASWFKTNYEDFAKVPSDFNQARWRIEHTRLLSDLITERQAAGDRVSIEGQNRFRYRRPSRLVLSGVPDLVATSRDGTATVYDAKTGQPKASDQIQAMIYMYCVPRCHPDFEGETLQGCIVYREHRVTIPATVIDERFVENFNHFLDMLDGEAPARKVPSELECGYCDITTADCPERVAADENIAMDDSDAP